MVITAVAFSQTMQFSLLGKWQETEYKSNDGAKNYDHKIENGRILIFEDSSVLKDSNGTRGTYKLKGDCLNFEFANQSYYYRLFFDEYDLKKIAFVPTGNDYEIHCKEGCAFIYEQREIFKRKITGVIVDDKNNPLSGIQLIIRGSRKGLLTDSFGKFEFDVVPGDVLIASGKGYQETQYLVTNKIIYKFKLVEKPKLNKPSSKQKMK